MNECIGLLYIHSDACDLAVDGEKDHLHLLLQSVLSSVGEKLLDHWHADCHKGRRSCSCDHTPCRPYRTTYMFRECKHMIT